MKRTNAGNQAGSTTRTSTMTTAMIWPKYPLARLMLALLLLCGGAGMAQAQDANGVCRVTTTGVNANDGADWAHPKNLMSALAFNCKEVWVAQGVYFADAYPFYFTIIAKSKVYGGFAGNETSSAQADPMAHRTILSGDKDHNDTNTDGNFIDESFNDIKGTNAQIVVKLQGNPSASLKITNTTVLDGFTITGGDSKSISGFGGGVSCYGVGPGNECSPTLSRLVIVGNQAGYGGGLYLNGQAQGISSPVIEHVVFANNHATQQGGALFCEAITTGTCNPTLTDVAFAGNLADSYGGAIYLDARVHGVSSPSLTDVTFDHNNATQAYGGAMMNLGNGGTSSPSLLNVTFSNNSALVGGAMYNLGQQDGSGIAGISHPLLRNVTFKDNHATSFGGGMYNWGASYGDCSPTLINVTFSGNSAGTKSGGAFFATAVGSGNSDISLTNVIMWGNTAGQSGSNIYIDRSQFATYTLSIDFSDLQGGDGSIAFDNGAASTAWSDGIGNFSGDPHLGPLADNGGATLTMAPGPGDAIDNGICAGAPGTDQRWIGRPQGGGCDIGAVEAEAVIDEIFKNGFE